MRKCRTVKGLTKAIQHKESAFLKVWGIMPNDMNRGGVLLNLGEGRYVYVGKTNWELIRNHVVDQDGGYCKNNSKYRYYYPEESVA